MHRDPGLVSLTVWWEKEGGWLEGWVRWGERGRGGGRERGNNTVWGGGVGGGLDGR